MRLQETSQATPKTSIPMPPRKATNIKGTIRSASPRTSNTGTWSSTAAVPISSGRDEVLQFAFVNAAVSGGFSTLGPVVADGTIGRAAWGDVLAAQTAGMFIGGLIALCTTMIHSQLRVYDQLEK
jgi:hypothetical protein